MTHGPIWQNDSGVFIRVLVRPRSKEKLFVEEITSDHILVNLSSPAREGKANSELVKRMAKGLGLSTSQLILVSGQKSKEKVIFIEGGSLDAIQDALSQ